MMDWSMTEWNLAGEPPKPRDVEHVSAIAICYLWDCHSPPRDITGFPPILGAVRACDWSTPTEPAKTLTVLDLAFSFGGDTTIDELNRTRIACPACAQLIEWTRLEVGI